MSSAKAGYFVVGSGEDAALEGSGLAFGRV
jgi:hypothetical protein